MRRALTIAATGCLTLLACGADPETTAWREELGSSDERSAEAEAALHPVVIHEPSRLTSIAAGDSENGVACATCHSLPDLGASLPSSTADVGGPHVGLRFEHGTNTCASCHAPDDVASLRRADGVIVPMREAMTLCAQCHGPQYRDYQHGSHGGMEGHWDRTVGPRRRNHCVDCHDPHTPRYPRVLPMPAPRDRVRPVGGHGSHEVHHD